MLTTSQLLEPLRKVRAESRKRNFTQSVELILSLEGIDPKKQELNINEVVFLPHKLSSQSGTCLFAGGELAVRAKQASVDRIVEPDELERLSGSKKELKKIAKSYEFFLAEPSMMPKIGRALGPFLGPKGKMPTPVAPSTPLESLIQRYRSAIRIRGRGQLSLSCKVGEEGMQEAQIAENTLAVMTAVEKKLPQGSKNLRGAFLKLTMGKLVSIPLAEK